MDPLVGSFGSRAWACRRSSVEFSDRCRDAIATIMFASPFIGPSTGGTPDRFRAVVLLPHHLCRFHDVNGRVVLGRAPDHRDARSSGFARRTALNQVVWTTTTVRGHFVHAELCCAAVVMISVAVTVICCPARTASALTAVQRATERHRRHAFDDHARHLCADKAPAVCRKRWWTVPGDGS